MKRKVLVELFTEDCPACAGWFGYGHELTSSSQEYELRVRDPREGHDAAEREIEIDPLRNQAAAGYRH